MSAAELDANTVATVAPLRRTYIVEALDGVAWQVGGAVHFLERGEDAAAERAMARAIDFARSAAAEMRRLRGEQADRLSAATQPAGEANL